MLTAADYLLYPGSLLEWSSWAPPEDITVAEWAERYRVLPKSSAIPGKWSNKLGPYAVGVMDAFNDPWVERITIMASVQSMKTESVYNMLGYAACQDPGPAVIVMPTLNTMKRVNRRIRRMLMISEELSRHLTGNPDDVQMHQIILDRMDIYFATAGSDADLQNIEARYVICDETDEYPFNAEQGDLVEKAIDRSTTFWNRKIILLSRPTTGQGYINASYEKSDRRKYWVPCPFCGGFQVLTFGQVVHKGEKPEEWPKDRRDPEYISLHRVARYACVHCGEEIDDQHKPALLAGGKWVPEGHDISKFGDMAPLPPTVHVGFWWNVLYSPFRTFSEVAAQFFKVKDDQDKLRIFVNQWLAEPWKEVVQCQEPSAVLQLRTSRPSLVVPDGTVGLTAGVDTQKRGYWVSIWAWVNVKPRIYEQHLIRYGWVFDELELETWLFQDVYWNDSHSIAYPVWRVGKDTGGGEGYEGSVTMTEQVYNWLRRIGRQNVFGIKGASRSFGRKMKMDIQGKMPGGKPIPGGVRLWLLDTGMLKDSFWSRVSMGLVHLHADTGEDFARHLASEVKERNARGQEVWVQQGRQPNHLLDTSIYAMAMADEECWGGVTILAPPQSASSAATQEPSGWLAGRGNWLKR